MHEAAEPETLKREPAEHGRFRFARLLLPTARSDVTLRWHGERDVFSLSLWHDDACVASATLTPADAADLAAYLVTRLAERPAEDR
jgi:hypothetical protein